MIWARFLEVAARRPEQLAIEDEQGGVSFGALRERALRLGEFVAGAGRALVALALPSGTAFTLSQLGAWSANAAVVPLPPACTSREASDFIETLHPDLLVVESPANQRSLIEALRRPTTILSVEAPAQAIDGGHRLVTFERLGRERPLRARAGELLPEEVCLAQFTSGSTGRPRAILFSARSLAANLEANGAALARFEGQAVFSPLPQCHAMGGAVVLEYLLHGACVQLSNRFLPAQDVRRMRALSCRAIAGSPSYLKLLLRLGALRRDHVPSLASFTLGSAAAEPALIRGLHAAYPDALVQLRYGLSESLGALSTAELRRGDEPRAGLAGRLVAGVEFAPEFSTEQPREAEIIVRGPCSGVGVIEAGQPARALLDERGYLRTGDVGLLADDGQLLLRGRSSSYVKVNGFRVSPLEVELVLKELPGVHEAVVVEAPEGAASERLIALLEREPARAAPAPEELDSFCRARLSAHKVPERFVFVAELPRTAAGKPDRVRARREVAR